MRTHCTRRARARAFTWAGPQSEDSGARGQRCDGAEHRGLGKGVAQANAGAGARMDLSGASHFGGWAPWRLPVQH